MNAGNRYASLNMPHLDKSSEPDQYSTLALLEGLALMQAFSKISREEDRLRIIALAERLSKTGT
jgi:hypothetical protein